MDDRNVTLIFVHIINLINFSVMKKSLILIAAMAMISLGASAQNYSFIAKGSLNLSTFTGDDATNPDMIVGGRVGIGMEFPVAGAFSIQPTIFLSQKGAKSKIYSNTITDKVHAWYVDMPINAQYRFGITSGVNFIAAAGPYIAYGAFGKSTADVAGHTADRDTFDNDYYQYKRFDAGVNFELALELEDTWQINCGYQIGMVKILDSDKYNDVKNGNIFIGLGYRF